MPTDELRKQQEDERAARYGMRKGMLPPGETVYKAEDKYWGAHQDHFINFFEGMRTGETVPEDAVFGFRAAAPALLCNDSYFEEKMLRWDPVNMQVIE